MYTVYTVYIYIYIFKKIFSFLKFESFVWPILIRFKPVLKKIGIGFCVFIICIKCVLFFATKQTSAYNSAINFIKTDPGIASKVGKVKSIFLEPFGGMSMTTGSQGTAGQADLHFIVKGAKKYIDLNLLLYKEFETDWKIEIAE